LNTQGIETLKAVARRSLWLIALLVLLGVVLMNVLRHSQGPQYQASARVILSPTDLSQQFSGSSAYIDPDLLDQTGKALAGSPQLYSDAARQSSATASELRGSTSASKNGTTITFTSVADNPDDAIRYANAVAAAYPRFRAGVASAAIENAITQVQSQLGTSGASRPELETQLNRLKVLKTLTSGNVLLVVPATGSDKTRPSPVKDSIIGGLIGFFVAMVIIALREAIDTRVRSAEEVEDVLDAPVVGTVETLPRKTGLVIGNKKGERFGDMYALLAANLAQEREDGPTVIAVTSATAEEGKTTTASNLAAALARRNKRVLLVDLDTRKPTVGKVFQIPEGAPGLEEIFRRRVNPSSLMWTIALNGTPGDALPTELTRGAAADMNGSRGGTLRILPLSGPLRGGITGHVARVEALLASAAKNHDYVVIDTPPALALPNVTEMADLIDVVIVVVRHGRVTRRSLNALNRLQQRWSNVKTNAVLVGVPRQETYSYYEE
jgi:succinoglycan biosynthesis transport protein ExoP